MSIAARRRLVLLGSFLLSQAILLFLLRMPPVPGNGSWLKAFRGFFPYDQLSYAAIASTAAAGDGGLPEPFTETGHSYYPSLWYRLMGWIAAATGMSVPTAWTVLGYLALAGCVAFAGYVGYRVSRLAWSPALVGPALCIGTLSIVLHDSWYTELESHALLWGPAAAVYVLNAEVAGYAAVSAALVMVLRVVAGPPIGRVATIAWLTAAAALIGVTANVQTYTFFVGISLAFGWAGAYGLVLSRSRRLLVVSGVLLVATFAFGPALAARIGALPTFSLLIAVTLPGVLWLARRAAMTLLLPAVVLVLVAAPQAVIVASGILAKDEFLTYRQDASALLGVPIWQALLASLPIAAIWLFNVAVQLHHRHAAVLAGLIGMAFAGTMLTLNDRWGFSQEPYRLWIASVTVSALLLAPITAWSIARLRAEPRAGGETLVQATAVAAVLLFAVSLVDVAGFRAYAVEAGVIRFDTDRYRALAELDDSRRCPAGQRSVHRPGGDEDRHPQARRLLQPGHRLAREPGADRRSARCQRAGSLRARHPAGREGRLPSHRQLVRHAVGRRGHHGRDRGGQRGLRGRGRLRNAHPLAHRLTTPPTLRLAGEFDGQTPANLKVGGGSWGCGRRGW